MGIKLQGGNNSTNLVSVNSLNQLQVVTPQDLTGVCAGFVQMSVEADAGTVLGTRTVIPPECSDDYRLRAGLDQTIFNSSFEGTTTLTTQWSSALTTFGSLQGQGFFTINGTAVTTASAAGYLRTWRLFPTFGTYPLYVDLWIREAGYDAVNAISEWGLLYLTAAATQQPIDGIYFRRLSGGQLKGIITNNSLDIAEVAIDVSRIVNRNGVGIYDPAKSNHYTISVHNDIVRFRINDVTVGEILCPSAQAQFASSSNLPVGLRVVNVNTSSIGRQLSVGFANVAHGDQNVNKPWPHAMTGQGQGSYQIQQGGTPGPTTTRGTGALGHPTSGTARIAGSWSATSNPGLNSLGGLWTSPAMSSIGTDVDYPIFAYLNPIGTAAIPGKTLYVTGVRIGDTAVTVAGGAATSIFLSYIVQVENSAVATSTSDTATATSGKATVIGGQGFGPSGTDPAGTMKPGFLMNFDPPLAIPAGKYFTVIVRPFGITALNTMVVTGSVVANGYFE
jgi:hypothetical protein